MIKKIRGVPFRLMTNYFRLRYLRTHSDHTSLSLNITRSITVQNGNSFLLSLVTSLLHNIHSENGRCITQPRLPLLSIHQFH